MFQSYLTNRKQFVKYNGFQSDYFVPTSSVPQGSVLGPFLFIIFINDLSSLISNCNHLFYADDLKIYSSISDITDCYELQSQLKKIQEWCSSHNLKLNAKKCKIMSYCKTRNPILFNYHLHNYVLERPLYFKDLGIIFDPEMTFVNHITDLVKSASKTLGFIYRNCRLFHDVETMIILFNSYVRSKLEYGSIIWFPIYDRYNVKIENVQRRFLKYLMYKCDQVYPQRGCDYLMLLDRFDFMSIETRRTCHSIMFLVKMLQNKIDCPALLENINIHVPRFASRQQLYFECPRARTNMQTRSPIYNMCSNTNLIINDIDIFTASLISIMNVIKNA